MNRRNLATAQGARGVERKIRRLAKEELLERSERSFQAYGAPLYNATEFKYLGRLMTAGDDDWSGRMSRILSR